MSQAKLLPGEAAGCASSYWCRRSCNRQGGCRKCPSSLWRLYFEVCSPPLRRRTQAALEMWQEMADKASTPSTVMMPSAKRAKTGEHGASAAPAAPADTAAAQGTDSQPAEAAAEARPSSRATAAPAKGDSDPMNTDAAPAAAVNKAAEAQESVA